MNNLLVTMLDKARVRTEKLGDATGELKILTERLGICDRVVAACCSRGVCLARPICVCGIRKTARSQSRTRFCSTCRYERGAARWRYGALAWAAYLDDLESAYRAARGRRQSQDRRRIWRDATHAGARHRRSGAGRETLKAGANAKAARWNGETALMIAANSGNAETVKQLIAAGADVNLSESRKGQTALMWAAAEGHGDVVQLLIARSADVKAASKSGFNALVFAAVKNDPKSVQSLIAAGADPNYTYARRHEGVVVAASSKSALAAGVWWIVAPIPTSPIARALRRCIPLRKTAMWTWSKNCWQKARIRMRVTAKAPTGDAAGCRRRRRRRIPWGLG